MDSLKCSVCDSTHITENSKYYAHHINDETHYMCDNCLKLFLRICSCDKKLNESPTKIIAICPCNEEKYTIDLDPQYIDFLLNKHTDLYYYIPCCRGCSYTREQIENDFVVALKSAIETCVFKVEINNKFKAVQYAGDSLEEDFVNYCNDSNIKLTGVDI